MEDDDSSNIAVVPERRPHMSGKETSEKKGLAEPKRAFFDHGKDSYSKETEKPLIPVLIKTSGKLKASAGKLKASAGKLKATADTSSSVIPETCIDMSELDAYMKKEPTRVFFERGQNGQLETTYEPADPVSIKSSNESKDFQVSVDTRTVHHGWYWAVFCVALTEIDDIQLKSIIFDVASQKMCTGIVYTKDYTCKTAIQRDEIDHLPRTKFARLRLHRQIEIIPDTVLSVSIKVETVDGYEEVMPFDLHYFELAYHDIRSEDHILWGEGKPDQYIRMGDNAASETRPIAIEAYDFSPTGKLAVTVYFSPAESNSSQVSAHTIDNARVHESHQSHTHVHARAPTPTHDHSQTPENLYNLDQDHSHISSSIYTRKVAHVDVWDLSVPSGQVVSDNPQAITVPLKRFSFPVRMLKKPPDDSREKKSSGDPSEKKSSGDSVKQSPEGPPEPPLPTINISSTGFHIIMAVGWETRQVHATPFLIYRVDQSSPEPYDYKRVHKTCQSIQKFYGYGAFHHSDQVDPQAENERYFNFHGSNFDVYSTNGGWKQLYSLSFGINGVLRRPEEMFYLYQSLRGRYFAWTGDIGTVSIWEFETGKFVTTIVIPIDTRGVCAALSEDGSMVAITVNGRIQVHDVASGIKLGFRKAQWKEDNGSEIIFKHDYFMALDAERSTSGKKKIDAYSIFRVRDMKIVKTHFVPWEYRVEFSSTMNSMFLYQQGAILNIKRLGNILCPTEDNGCAPDIRCEFQSTELDLIGKTWSNKNQSSTETSFVVGPDHSPSDRSSIMRLAITNIYRNTSISLGPENSMFYGFFVAAGSQLVLILNGFLQVWRLPSEADKEYELVHIEAFVAVSKSHANDICQTKVSSVQSCMHGRKFIIEIQPIQWMPDPKNREIEDESEKQEFKYDPDDDDEEEEYPDSDHSQTLTFPRTAEDTFPTSGKYRYEKGVASLLDTYADSESGIKDAIIRFLIDRIRPSSKYSSSLVILCRSWKYGRRAIFEELITKLLHDGERHTWIPDINATKKENPLSILVKTAKKSPYALGACKIIMDYCVNHAIGSKNLAFLSPLLLNLKRIMVLFPHEARVYLRKMAYIPVSDRWRDYIVERSTVTHSPWHCLMRFRKTPLRLDKLKKPIMHLHVTPELPRNKADTFHRPIYAAAFDALWHFKDNHEFERENSGDTALEQLLIVKPWSLFMLRSLFRRWLQRSAVEQESIANHAVASRRKDLTWWRILYHTIRLKFHLKTHTYVRCHNFGLEFFDNPAIAALITYKWNTIGYAYWSVRFIFQGIFYVLVIVAALLQVYHETVGRVQLGAVFIAIIVAGTMFLWLELLQALRDFKRYRCNPYNFLDVVAYSLPMIASFVMLVALCNNNAVANTRILSYSVLAVFLHMLFELRIYKGVGKYVGVIRRSLSKTRVFLLIFAGGLVAFSIATLHLLRACPVPGLCNDSTTKFSKHFLGALSATYFFVGGRFEPVAEELESEDWAFHLMMVVFFFFTVIVMLNVLIALINMAFSGGDDDSRLDCIDARLQCIELAENLSYHIPGLRQTRSWFPKEIYFCATTQAVEEYGEEKLTTHFQNLKMQLASQQEKAERQAKALKDRVQHLEQQLTSQQEQEERRFQELRSLLVGRAGYSSE